MKECVFCQNNVLQISEPDPISFIFYENDGDMLFICNNEKCKKYSVLYQVSKKRKYTNHIFTSLD